MPDHIIHAEIRLENCAVEMCVNDIPLVFVPFDRHKFYSQPIHEFLVNGSNELAVLVNPGPTPSAALQPAIEERSQQAWIRARIVEYAEGEITGERGRELGAIAWDSGSSIAGSNRLSTSIF